MSYLTDGVHLYEVLARVRNFGRLGGEFVQVRDVVSERTRMMGLLEQALCRLVG